MAHIPTHQRGTEIRPDIGKEDIQLSPKQICIAKGGKWINNECIFPTPDKRLPAGVFDITGTSKQGITTPEGETFFGLNKDEIRDVIRQKTGGLGQPETIGLQSEAIAAQEEQEAIERARAKIGNVGQLTEAEAAKINKSQALTAGIIGSAGNIAKVAGGVALAGAVGVAIVPLIGLAALGITAAILSGYISNVKEQQRGEISASKEELAGGMKIMRQMAMMATQNPANADVYVGYYNNQLTRVLQAQRQVKADTDGDLRSWMEDGREDLAKFDLFVRPKGIADTYGEKLDAALHAQVPLTEADFLFDEVLL